MTTLTPTPTPEPPLVGPVRKPDTDQVVEMRGVGWAGYKTVARLRHGRSRPKLIYLDGDLTLVSPGQAHERLNVQVRRFFDEVVMSLRIPTFALGQMTWRRRKQEVAVEGDQTYYIANEALVRGKKIDLRVDPPPDLAIEVVVTNKADHALEVYARLGVPKSGSVRKIKFASSFWGRMANTTRRLTASPCLSCPLSRSSSRASNPSGCRTSTTSTDFAVGSAKCWFPE